MREQPGILSAAEPFSAVLLLNWSALGKALMSCRHRNKTALLLLVLETLQMACDGLCPCT